MSKVAIPLISFNGGELSPLLGARTDLSKYLTGYEEGLNVIPTVQGPLRRRPGTPFIAATKTSSQRSWYVEFIFSVTDAWVLEFGHQYIRFYTSRAQVLSAGVPYEIASPYTTTDLTAADNTCNLRYVQSADVLYLVHGSHAIRKLSRTAPTSWTLSTVTLNGGPFQTVNTTATTVYANASTGSVTLTASTSIFTANHVGVLFLLEANPNVSIQAWEVSKAVSSGDLRRSDGNVYESQTTATTGTIKPTHTEGIRSDGAVDWEYLHSGYGWCVITAQAGTTATATVISYLPSAVVGSGNATTKWAFGEIGAHNGYPTDVTFFRERLVFIRDDKVWTSVVGDYENFRAQEADQITPDMAISLQLSSNQVNKGKWLSPGKGLLVGTTGAEFLISEVTLQEALGPANVKAAKQSSYGSRNIRALEVQEVSIFVQASGLKLRAMQYSFDQDKFVAADTTVLSEHITLSGIIATCYQQEPDCILWCLRNDGLLLGFTFNQEQEVKAWHRHKIAGSFGSGDAVVESIASIPSPDGSRHDVWLIVKRTINGSTKRYVELMGDYFTSTTPLEDAFFVDCGATYDGAPATTISGLSHLEGQTVTILADGATHPTRVVTGGAITLQRAASKVHVGLGYSSYVKTMRLDGGSQNGTSQGKTKRVNKVFIRFLDTVGGFAGPDADHLDEIYFRSGSDPMDEPVPLFSGDKEVPWPAGYEKEPRLRIQQNDPLPQTIVAIYPQFNTYDP